MTQKPQLCVNYYIFTLTYQKKANVFFYCTHIQAANLYCSYFKEGSTPVFFFPVNEMIYYYMVLYISV